MTIKAGPVKLYIEAAAGLCKPRRLISLIITVDGSKSDWVESVLKEHKRWEEMVKRQEPVATEMILLQIKVSLKSNEDSFDAAMRDWLVIGHYAGFRLSEWSQEQKLVNKGMFASNDPAEGGDGSAKAFTLEDFIFLGKKGKRLPNTPKRVLQDK
eukprot:4906823-Ditylum_brightwellii.AAC.1